MLFLTQEEELKFEKPIQVLYFYASWMPYHKKMLTMIGKMEDKYNQIDYFAVDVDYFKTFLKRFEISTVPTVILLKNNKEAKRIEGVTLTSAFKSVFADICKS